MNRQDTRRGFLLATTLAAGFGLIGDAFAQELAPTPECKDGDEPTVRQTEGPFFKPSSPVRADLREGDIGTPLGEIAKANPDTIIGSYPFQEDGRPNTNIVVRSRDPQKLAAAKAAVEAMLAQVRAGLRRSA